MDTCLRIHMLTASAARFQAASRYPPWHQATFRILTSMNRFFRLLRANGLLSRHRPLDSAYLLLAKHDGEYLCFSVDTLDQAHILLSFGAVCKIIPLPRSHSYFGPARADLYPHLQLYL